MNNSNTDASRPMVEGSWQCSQCGAEITRLPFSPSPDRMHQLKCLDCFKSNRPQHKEHKMMFEGSWTCVDCGKEITKMPFEPKGDKPIRCIDCFRASR